MDELSSPARSAHCTHARVAASDLIAASTFRRLATAILAAALLLGCGPKDEITVTQSERTEPPAEPLDVEAAANSLDHMLTAIVPHEGKAWFFKVVVDADQAEQVEAELQQLLSTVSVESLSADAKTPNWQLPEGWSESPGSGLRDATILMQTGDDSHELAVSSLPLGSDWTEFLTVNVNRWMNQLGQAPLDADTIESLVDSKQIIGGEATLAHLRGVYSQPGRRGMMPADHPPIASSPESTDEESERDDSTTAQVVESDADQDQPDGPQTVSGAQRTAGPLSYVQPESWTDGRQSSTRRASLAAPGGIEISVTDWPATGLMADLDANLQRWARETGSNPSDAEVEDASLGGIDGRYIKLEGSERSTLVAMVQRGDRVWFFKLSGPGEAVAKQRDAFDVFLRSIEFAQP